MAPRRYLLSAVVVACVLAVATAPATDAAVVDPDHVGDGAAYPTVADDMGELSVTTADAGNLDGVAAGRQSNSDVLAGLRSHCFSINLSCVLNTRRDQCGECNDVCKRYQLFASSIGRRGHTTRGRNAAKACRRIFRSLG